MPWGQGVGKPPSSPLPSAFFPEAPLVLPGAWPLRRVPKEQAFSLGAATCTPRPHPTQSPEWEPPRSFQEHGAGWKSHGFAAGWEMPWH